METEAKTKAGIKGVRGVLQVTELPETHPAVCCFPIVLGPGSESPAEPSVRSFAESI